ncbi:MAG TPA: glycosyltransferase family 4 protein [Solirubrobacteraceae bacterium]|nr:glycosyltransferase family 4 protein [Solirubrobacteraceae bacterium]
MTGRTLHIAWVGFPPSEEVGGVPGIATDLLHGLAALGHRIDCYFPGQPSELPRRLAGLDSLTVLWAGGSWQWGRWYSRTRITAFVSALVANGLDSFRHRGELQRRHRAEPYDFLYQFSNVENLAIPRDVARSVPLVAHPGQSSADALRFLLRERRLYLRSRPFYKFAVAALVLWLRKRVQRRKLRSAQLVICISHVFREHLIRDYGISETASVVVPNPVRVDRFVASERPCGNPARIIVLGRIATGKGVEDVVALAKLLREREVAARVRLVGGTSMWSDYTALLAELPPENAEYAGRIEASLVPGELAESDVLLQASKYEAFALTVAEALSAGVPVVATTEVGAIEQVDRSVAAAVAPGDVQGMQEAITAMLERLRDRPGETRALARAEAERLFAPEVVCGEISSALQARAVVRRDVGAPDSGL